MFRSVIKMKETILSACEKGFVVQCIKENQRLDGRSENEFRPLRINFGDIWSSVHVSLGETRDLAQVSCELGQPKSTRSNEGMLYINVELSPMAAGHFEVERSSDLTVQINRTLERTLKDSKCVDLESLCITAEDKVWILRCDLVILNHDGNLIDCASVAALCSLAHFKCPDVTVCGEEIKVHTAAERDPIPLALHHYPVCVSYATFQDGETIFGSVNYCRARSVTRRLEMSSIVEFSDNSRLIYSVKNVQILTGKECIVKHGSCRYEACVISTSVSKEKLKELKVDVKLSIEKKMSSKGKARGRKAVAVTTEVTQENVVHLTSTGKGKDRAPQINERRRSKMRSAITNENGISERGIVAPAKRGRGKTTSDKESNPVEEEPIPPVPIVENQSEEPRN